ncbi:hypothetical protein Q8A67_005578 [Cirrhinus molitorella]|nr:hypothetical protein Q8A67_005578 [Cirrhinus molitorella]
MTAARSGLKNARSAGTERNLRGRQDSNRQRGGRPDPLIDGVHSSRRGLTVWSGGPRAPHHLHGYRLLDAVSLLRERSQSGPLEVLHQSQVPQPHSECGILGRHAGLHAAVGPGLLRWSCFGRHCVQTAPEPTGADRRNRPAAVRFSSALGFGHLHRHDRQLLRQTLHRLEILLVLYLGLDRHHIGFGSRRPAAVCVSEERLRASACERLRQLKPAPHHELITKRLIMK